MQDMSAPARGTVPAASFAMTLLLAACTVQGPASDRSPPGPADEPEVSFHHEPNVLQVHVGGRHFADYVYSDSRIRRPYFAQVKSPLGSQATRLHPPDPEEDLTDHAEMHPGIWMAFGDINGNDYWRFKARVEHERFIQAPRGLPGKGSFAVRNYYRNEEDTDRIGSEEAYFTIRVQPGAYLLVWQSKFAPYGETAQLAFGDQEELGLGIRVQTRLAEQFGGTIRDSEGRRGAQNIWGKTADWIDYSGTLDGRWIGMAILPDPRNFRPSWYHARDYGLIVANVFGREAMKAGPKSEVLVSADQPLWLRYGILVHSGDSEEQVDLVSAYDSFLEVLTQERVE